MTHGIKKAALAAVAKVNDWLEAHEGEEGIDEASFLTGCDWLAERLLSDESVERAAREMYASDRNNDGYAFEDDADRGYWRAQARVALSAALGKGQS